ncbi:lactonase family protein [Streptomyces sp. NBC_00986]|uniref:lactonase family protein n=1 Tax=Streptomyces sp. NBC_00986 TaxID=2903702 RepID=UPI00386D77EE|nr:lactonase family protein [Streptomyces sp. NBC_00986]
MTLATRTRILATGATGAALAAAALFAAPAAVAAEAHHAPDSRAQLRGGSTVFVQSDNTDANTVVAYARAADGTLARTGVHSTGGKGGMLPGTVADHLASQGSLAYDRHNQLLYAVNAGSDTVTVFAVHGTHLRRVQEISSGGSFPVSVTFHGNRVYVANTLGGGSVQGFVRTGERLVKVPSWNRNLGLDKGTSVIGQISFTPDGSKLVVTTKASGQSIDVFPLGGVHGGPSARPVVTSTPGAVPFGFAFDSAGRILVTEAGTNSVGTFTVGRDGRLTAKGTVPTGQTATCWAVTAGDQVYVSNAGSGTLSGYRVGAGGGLTALGNTATHPGTVDAAASSDGRYLYVQTGVQGTVDEFRVGPKGSLTAIGSVVVPGAVGGEGITAG